MTGRFRTVPKTRVVTYWRKALELAQASQALSERGLDSAASITAAHSAISALDSVCIASFGQRAADTDHHQVLTLLRQLHDPEVPAQSRRFTALLDLRRELAYEERLATPEEAKDAVLAAQRLIDWARRYVPGSA